MKLKKIFLFFVLILSSLAAVEHSIIPMMESNEFVENLPVKKYSSSQYAEIKEGLTYKDKRIRVVTYNLLFDIYDDKQEENYRWPQRLPRIISLIQEMKADVIGVQEPYKNQVKSLLPYLENTYGFYSKPLDKGEHCGILYRKDRFSVVDSKVLAMTEKSMDVLTILRLKDLKTNKIFAVLNTHLSFGNVESRLSQTHFIARQAEEISKEMPIIFMGDLNTFPNRLDLQDLPFYDGDYIHRILTEKVLKDSKEISLLGHLGPIGTFTNNGKDIVPFAGTGTPGVFLDHIYVSKGIKVLIHAVESGTVDGWYPSDHMPVIADIVIE